MKQLALGWGYSCALMTDNTVQCWGEGDEGQLGNGTSGAYNYVACPVPVENLLGVTAISAQNSATCALAPKGISCWGTGFQIPAAVRDVPATVHFFGS